MRADRVEAVDGDMHELPLPGDAFDLTLASPAIHNLPPGDRPGAVRELLRVVRPSHFRGRGYTPRGGAADVRVSGRHWSTHPPVRVVTATAT